MHPLPRAKLHGSCCRLPETGTRVSDLESLPRFTGIIRPTFEVIHPTRPSNAQQHGFVLHCSRQSRRPGFCARGIPALLTVGYVEGRQGRPIGGETIDGPTASLFRTSRRSPEALHRTNWSHGTSGEQPILRRFPPPDQKSGVAASSAP
jgi:hypothetical protein